MSDDYFIERKLYPNVDFYSGIIYRALGFPTDMFTVLFALGRLPGWMAQWKELKTDPKTRIYRPQQVYVGENPPRLPRYRRSLATTARFESTDLELSCQVLDAKRVHHDDVSRLVGRPGPRSDHLVH